jgi:hypothetical protein
MTAIALSRKFHFPVSAFERSLTRSARSKASALRRKVTYSDDVAAMVSATKPKAYVGAL